MRYLAMISAILLTFGCKTVGSESSNLLITNSDKVLDPKDAPGAVYLLFMLEDETFDTATGVRHHNQIYTCAHVLERRFKRLNVLDHAGRLIGGFTLPNPDIKLHSDENYQGLLSDPADRAALIFRGGALESLNTGMAHYQEYLSAEFATEPIKKNGQFRFVGAGAADYTYRKPKKDDLSPDEMAEFREKGVNGKLRMTNSDGSNFYIINQDMVEISGYPYQNGDTPLKDTPARGTLGVSVTGDSGGPVYEIGADGKMLVAGLITSGSYLVPAYDTYTYLPTLDENGMIDFNKTTGGVDNFGKTYRYPEFQDGGTIPEVDRYGRAYSVFISTSSPSFQAFVAEVDKIAAEGW